MNRAGPDKATKRTGCAPAVRRRGSIYAVVLAMAILVSLIGLSAVAVGRINLRSASAGGDASSAELLALSAVEHGVAVINSDSTWRTDYQHETPTASLTLGTGTFNWMLRDEYDRDLKLSSGGLQPVRLVGIGQVGEARRGFSVVLVPTGTNQLSNPGIESGVTPFEPESGNCVVDITSADPHGGVRSLWVRSRTGPSGGPRQDVTGRINNTRWYYVEAWMKMSQVAEEPVFRIVVRKAGSSDQVFTSTKPPPVVPAVPAQQAGLTWTKISLPIYVNWSNSYDNIYWRVETTQSNQDFYLDDLKLIEGVNPTPMAPARETWRQEALP
jgi:hypothetical protein